MHEIALEDSRSDISLSTEEIEIKLLVDAIYYTYGYDFRDYAFSSQKRRFIESLKKNRFSSFSELQHSLIRDKNLFYRVLSDLTVTVSEFFRDPELYQEIRKSVVKELETYSTINIWHAGCAQGQEVYSFATLLKEENLLDRCQIYATDINPKALKTVQKGVYPPEMFKKSSEKYFKAGGTESFSNYYHTLDHAITFDKNITSRIVFVDHNLASDYSFGQMNVIFCRNVLIYFNKILRNRALSLLRDSLLSGGFLVLGNKESLLFSSVCDDFDEFDGKNSIYRKKWK